MVLQLHALAKEASEISQKQWDSVPVHGKKAKGRNMFFSLDLKAFSSL